MAFPKYGWVGNQINPDDMKKMYRTKVSKKIPITKQVAKAVALYVRRA